MLLFCLSTHMPSMPGITNFSKNFRSAFLPKNGFGQFGIETDAHFLYISYFFEEEAHKNDI